MEKQALQQECISIHLIDVGLVRRKKRTVLGILEIAIKNVSAMKVQDVMVLNVKVILTLDQQTLNGTLLRTLVQTLDRTLVQPVHQVQKARQVHSKSGQNRKDVTWKLLIARTIETNFDVEDFPRRHAVLDLNNAHKSALMSNIVNMQFGIRENI